MYSLIFLGAAAALLDIAAAITTTLTSTIVVSGCGVPTSDVGSLYEVPDVNEAALFMSTYRYQHRRFYPQWRLTRLLLLQAHPYQQQSLHLWQQTRHQHQSCLHPHLVQLTLAQVA